MASSRSRPSAPAPRKPRTAPARSRRRRCPKSSRSAAPAPTPVRPMPWPKAQRLLRPKCDLASRPPLLAFADSMPQVARARICTKFTSRTHMQQEFRRRPSRTPKGLMNNLDVFRSQPRDTKIKLHGREAFEGMRKAGQLAAAALDMLVAARQAGRHHRAARRARRRVRPRTTAPSRRRSTTAASPRRSAPRSTTSSATASPTPSR